MKSNTALPVEIVKKVRGPLCRGSVPPSVSASSPVVTFVALSPGVVVEASEANDPTG